MIISETNISKIKSQIQKQKKIAPDKTIIIQAQTPEFNAKILENKNINILLSPEIHNRKDKQKQRDSGMNEHMFKLAKKNNISIAIDLNNLKNLDKKQKAKILARIRQNIMLAKKTKANIILFPESKYKKIDKISFFKTFKGSTKQVK